MERKLRSEELERLTQEQPELKEEISNGILKIRDAVCFVPPQYRYSGAVQYFVEAYNNSKADNLKEAVNSYDTYYFRMQSEANQQKLLAMQQRQEELLQEIEYQQSVMIQQMQWMELDLWLSRW
ncbi:MAG: hypothetical protein LIO96_14850 [Lachnospiraceae bacterium]|nr:hypothetical protein [Lachnospiraceae bacterium]